MTSENERVAALEHEAKKIVEEQAALIEEQHTNPLPDHKYQAQLRDYRARIRNITREIIGVDDPESKDMLESLDIQERRDKLVAARESEDITEDQYQRDLEKIDKQAKENLQRLFEISGDTPPESLGL